jgi:hypothetical protein
VKREFLPLALVAFCRGSAHPISEIVHQARTALDIGFLRSATQTLAPVFAIISASFRLGEAFAPRLRLDRIAILGAFAWRAALGAPERAVG